MSKNIWGEFYNELLHDSLLSLIKTFREIKLLFFTFILTIKNPAILITGKNINIKYLSAAKSSKLILKLVFLFITLHIFFDFNVSNNNIDQLIHEYFIFFAYIITIIIILIYSYLFNITGNFKINDTNQTGNLLVYMFNVIYFVIITLNLLYINPNDSVWIITGFSILFSIYFIFRIGKFLKYSFISLLFNCIIIIVLVTFLVWLNLIFTSSYDIKFLNQELNNK